jgi:hypothetical protein
MLNAFDIENEFDYKEGKIYLNIRFLVVHCTENI